MSTVKLLSISADAMANLLYFRFRRGMNNSTSKIRETP
jgi:hypothetical protein